MNTNRLLPTTLIVSSLFCTAAFGADAPKLETTKDKVSYSIGLNIGRNLKGRGYEADPSIIARGITDAVEGNTPALSEEEANTVMNSYAQELRTKQMEKTKEASAKNREAGEAFLAANAKKPGVEFKEITLADGKKATLQYKVLTKGTGEIPKENHTVTVNYRGTLIDGTEFDSSYKRNEPTSFGVTQVIKGWTEALLMMPVGSKWQLYIPADLAYGDQQKGPQILPGSTLIFDIELLSTKGPEPIVSDIIKVPSAEEMKNGAKIETIKAEDVEKLKAQQKK